MSNDNVDKGASKHLSKDQSVHKDNLPKDTHDNLHKDAYKDNQNTALPHQSDKAQSKHAGGNAVQESSAVPERQKTDDKAPLATSKSNIHDAAHEAWGPRANHKLASKNDVNPTMKSVDTITDVITNTETWAAGAAIEKMAKDYSNIDNAIANFSNMLRENPLLAAAKIGEALSAGSDAIAKGFVENITKGLLPFIGGEFLLPAAVNYANHPSEATAQQLSHALALSLKLPKLDEAMLNEKLWHSGANQKKVEQALSEDTRFPKDTLKALHTLVHNPSPENKINFETIAGKEIGKHAADAIETYLLPLIGGGVGGAIMKGGEAVTAAAVSKAASTAVEDAASGTVTLEGSATGQIGDVTAKPKVEIATKPTKRPGKGGKVDNSMTDEQRMAEEQKSKGHFGVSSDFQGADLKGAQLQGFSLIRVNLQEANLEGASLYRAILSGANLEEANLASAKLMSVDLVKSNLQRANLKGAHLTSADLREADMSGANLEGADLFGCNMEGVKLNGANLTGAKYMARMKLKGADLRGANLQGVDLRGANLSGVDLRGANLNGVNLEGANLTGANLSGLDLSHTNLKGVKVDEKTNMDDVKLPPLQTAPEVDWRPTETIPEDYYSL